MKKLEIVGIVFGVRFDIMYDVHIRMKFFWVVRMNLIVSFLDPFWSVSTSPFVLIDFHRIMWGMCRMCSFFS